LFKDLQEAKELSMLQMIEYGTNVVGGVTWKRRNYSFRPSCFNTVKDAVSRC
jgi:hypothetical protein